MTSLPPPAKALAIMVTPEKGWTLWERMRAKCRLRVHCRLRERVRVARSKDMFRGGRCESSVSERDEGSFIKGTRPERVRGPVYKGQPG